MRRGFADKNLSIIGKLKPYALRASVWGDHQYDPTLLDVKDLFLLSDHECCMVFLACVTAEARAPRTPAGLAMCENYCVAEDIALAVHVRYNDLLYLKSSEGDRPRIGWCIDHNQRHNAIVDYVSGAAENSAAELVNVPCISLR